METWRHPQVYKPHVLPVTFRLPSAAASSFIFSSSSSLVVALLHPREQQAAAPRCDGSSSVFNYRGGWEVCLSSDEPMDERQRAERRRRRLGLEEVTSNARARLLIGGTQAGGGWKAFLKTFCVFPKVCHHLRFLYFLFSHAVRFKWSVSANISKVLTSAASLSSILTLGSAARWKKSTYVFALQKND